MKRLLVCLAAVVVMSACVTVEDFGTYWNLGFADPALEGTWKNIGWSGESKPEPLATVRFTRAGDGYALQAIKAIDPAWSPERLALERAHGERLLPGSARSLKVGDATFLMLGGPGATGQMMVRYEMRGDMLSEYWIEHVRASEFLRQQHPPTKNITSNAGGLSDIISIRVFDDDVFQVLSELAAKPELWRLEGRYQKVR
jgi:hypothetical protein